MKMVLWYPHGYDPRYAQGWALSIVLHVTMIALAIGMLSDLHLATQPDAFRWQVSVVGRTGQSAAQELMAAPMESRAAQPTPAIPPVNESPPVQKTDAVPHPAGGTKITTPHLPSLIPSEKQKHSVKDRTQPAPHVAPSPNVRPEVTAPTNSPAATQPETTIPALSPSFPAEDDSNKFPLPAASSAPAEEPAASPSRDASMVARVPIDIPPAAVAPSHSPEESSSKGYSPALSPPVQEARGGSPDFSWLTDSLRNKVKESQRYSTVARLNGMEGRVVLRITVKENGELLVAVTKSSGHKVLDQDAVEQVKRLSPLPLPRPLGRPQQALNLPIIYSLHQ